MTSFQPIRVVDGVLLQQLRSGRTMEDWRRYLVQLETAGIIYGGIVVRPGAGSSHSPAAAAGGGGYVKTNGWTHDVAELAALRKEMTARAKIAATEPRSVEVQGEQFGVRPAAAESATPASGRTTLVGVCKAARTCVAAALAVDGSLVVAIGALSAGDAASARCVREVQWIADMCGP